MSEDRPAARGAARRTLAWPVKAYGRAFVAALNIPSIRAGAQDIRALWAACRGKPLRATVVVDDADRAIHIPMTAQVFSARPSEIERHFSVKLARTAVMTRVYAALGASMLLAWAGHALLHPQNFNVLSAIIVPGLTLAAFLKALLEAVTNWQIRSGTMGGFGAFLRSELPLWPPMPKATLRKSRPAG